MPTSAAIRHALLVPELAEVYLLLDNISAVASKQVPDLDKDPVFASGQPKPWIQQICDIRWPPEQQAATDNALDAAKLIRAKDALNGAAWPATGSSIAFTLMLSGDTRSGRSRIPWWKRLFGQADKDEDDDPTFGDDRDRLCTGGALTRISLATLAYPVLYRNMLRNRVYYNFINGFLVVWLILTCLLSWDVAAGSAMLNRVNSLKTIQVTSAKDKATAGTAAGTAAGTVSDPAARTAAESGFSNDLPAALQNLQTWVTANHDLSILVGGWEQSPFVANPVPEATRVAAAPVPNVEWAAVLIGVLAGTILPICYGVLGASAAVVRNIVARISSSTLMPRDLILSLVQLGLGAVIGACVGLFVTSDGNGAAGENGLLGPVHLSGAALCFLAGFGVEGVFRALESLVGRVFPVGSTAATPKATQVTPAPTK